MIRRQPTELEDLRSLRQVAFEQLDHLSDWVESRFPYETKLLAQQILIEAKQRIRSLSLYDVSAASDVSLEAVHRVWELFSVDKSTDRLEEMDRQLDHAFFEVNPDG